MPALFVRRQVQGCDLISSWLSALSVVEKTVNYPRRFSDADLEQIVEEAIIYMCACPAQVATELRRLRELIAYQNNCEINSSRGDVAVVVHQRIAAAAIDAHARMEACLDEVLDLEGWDRVTLRMSEGLRRLRMDVLENDLP